METLDVLDVRTSATGVDDEEVDTTSSMEDVVSAAGASTATGVLRSPPLGMALAKELVNG